MTAAMRGSTFTITKIHYYQNCWQAVRQSISQSSMIAHKVVVGTGRKQGERGLTRDTNVREIRVSPLPAHSINPFHP
jgi:hypothetical protein